MLVYGAGQFFVPHQDSEEADAMVGSLVVTLPSSFKGGALVVRHAGMSATYRSPKKSLSLVAFYADCRHEVRPVTSGYRVTLTYNLFLQGDAAPWIRRRRRSIPWPLGSWATSRPRLLPLGARPAPPRTSRLGGWCTCSITSTRPGV